MPWPYRRSGELMFPVILLEIRYSLKNGASSIDSVRSDLQSIDSTSNWTQLMSSLQHIAVPTTEPGTKSIHEPEDAASDGKTNTQIAPTETASFPSLRIHRPSPEDILRNALDAKHYADVIFQTNDMEEFFAHRCILYKHSEIFVSLFTDKSELPIEIEVDFHAPVVKRAIEFCYGKCDEIAGFEGELITFADEYGMKTLKVSPFRCQ